MFVPHRRLTMAKVIGPGTVEEIDRFEAGAGWIAHRDETMQRASHVLATDAGAFVVDPVDAEGLDTFLAEFGDLAGVVVLFAYHARHAERIAERHDVPVYLPAGLRRVAVDAPIRRFSDALPGTRYDLLPVTITPLWREWALFDGETLVVAESVGAADYFLGPHESDLGVSHMRRAFPPTTLSGLAPDRILLGHGEGVHADAPAVLADALANARRGLYAFYRTNGRTMARTLRAALTT